MSAFPTNPPNLVLRRDAIVRLQIVTLVWMVVECGVSLLSAVRAQSPMLLAFGFDSFVELLSASLVFMALAPRFRLNRRRIDRASGILLFVLAAVVAATSVLVLVAGIQPEVSRLGIGITVTALVVMPILAHQKRKLARQTGNNALAADAVQSATCAYLALIALAGLGLNAAFHIAWVDSIAALAAIPVLIIEGRRAMRGQGCGCC